MTQRTTLLQNARAPPCKTRILKEQLTPTNPNKPQRALGTVFASFRVSPHGASPTPNPKGKTMTTRTHNNGDRRTIQTLLCEIFATNPTASNAEVVEAVLAEFPHSTYAEHRVQIDRNKYNKAKFKCQQGVAPSVPAENPLKRAPQQSTEPSRQLNLF